MSCVNLHHLIPTPSRKLAFAAAVLPVLFVLIRALKNPRRVKKVPNVGERVLILGGTSGIGRSVARQYAERGARVCVVGRRQPLLDEVIDECRKASLIKFSLPEGSPEDVILGVRADFADVDDMVRVREIIFSQWHGVDTLVVAAGVSALQPLLAIAGADVKPTELTALATSAEGIQKVANVAAAAVKGNYVGPLVAAVTFIPLLSATSLAPAVVLVNSLASVIPAPTRTLYASTKVASLVLYQALSIEHPNVAFSHFLPSTVEGDFRASAVDSGPVRELDPNKHGLKREDVARRCISAADRGSKTVFMPEIMRYAHLLYWIWPSFMEGKAREKYNFAL